MTAIQVADLNNGKVDVDHVAAFANSTALTATDRTGRSKRTLAGIDALAVERLDVIDSNAQAVLASLGYQVPVPYTAGLLMTVPNQTVSYFDGVSISTYAPIESFLPFTTSGSFETAKFRLIQGVSGADLGASTGALLVGFAQAGAGAVKRTVQAKAREFGISPQDFWLATDPDWTNAFERWAIAGGNYIPDGTYVLKRQITISGSGSLRVGNVVLDFSQATNAASFPDAACFYAYAGALVALPNLDAVAMPVAFKGQGALAFVSAPAVQRGDVVVIYNPTNGSYNAARTVYRAGEFVEVESVTGNTARIFGSLWDAYLATAVQMYRLPRASFTITGGRLQVIGSKAAGFDSVACTKFENYPATRLDNLAADNSSYAACELKRCYNVTGVGVDLNQANAAAGSNDYGLVASNSQKVRMDGRWGGGRHAVTTGGGDYVGSVPCRDGLISGFFSNAETAGQGVGAVNNHGNTEGWRFQGVINGGYSGGGNNNGIMPGSILIAKKNQNGSAIYMGEMLGFNFAFAGISITAYGDGSLAGGRGVIDVGGNSSSAINANTKYGGTFDITNTRINAPDAIRAFTMINSGCVTTEPLNIAAAGLQVQQLSASPNVAIYVGPPSGGGKAVDVLDLRGAIVPSLTYGAGSPYSLTASGTAKVRGWSRSGSVTGPASTGANTLALAVVYDQRAPRQPKVSGISLNRGRTGTQSFNVHVTGETTAGFTINITTTDGTNFASALSFTASWSATVEE
ncbi:tail spike protein [Variovorax phage VarioGold]|uniref:phage tailspike polysaccharide lyase family protein n=1 Tax=Variovorax sp. ZS18.2.2 TaxID=2971255 RepID=UPI00215071F2|nr:hypothetical protein [Variovorax sp. ZS18.2.2]MCR6477518.1 hypothetical protein [Variovorax sp. ZS18.2.2]UYD72067.1 tail spike protein [Variovorax phage VarioGold]